MSDLLTIDIAVARKALQSPETMDAFLDLLGQLSPESAPDLAPLVFDAIALDNLEHATTALEHIVKARPEWINLDNENSNTPLMEAVVLNRLDLVNLLLDAGAKTDHTNRKSMTALDMVCYRDFSLPSQHEIGQALLQKGSFTQAEKDRALYFSASFANLGMVQPLLSHGAQFDSRISPDGSALSAACRSFELKYPSAEIVRTMLQTEGGRSVLNNGWGNPDYGAYSSPIHCAAYAGNAAILSALVEAGARTSAPEHLCAGLPETPLMAAACGAQEATIKLLLQLGNDARAIDYSGAGLLHHLVSHTSVASSPAEETRCLDLLLSAGADPFRKDNRGKSPLDIARKNKRTAVSDALTRMLEAMALATQLEETTAAPVTPSTTLGPRF